MLCGLIKQIFAAKWFAHDFLDLSAMVCMLSVTLQNGGGVPIFVLYRRRGAYLCAAVDTQLIDR